MKKGSLTLRFLATNSNGGRSICMIDKREEDRMVIPLGKKARAQFFTIGLQCCIIFTLHSVCFCWQREHFSFTWLLTIKECGWLLLLQKHWHCFVHLTLGMFHIIRHTIMPSFNGKKTLAL